MAYTQKAGRANLESAQINSLTNNTPTDPPANSNFNAALYESSRNVSNGSSASQSSEVLSNPKLTTFRPRGSEAYKSSIHSANKNLTEFPDGVPASFSKGKGRTPHLNSRFNVNPSRKSNIANTMEEDQSLDIRTARIGPPQADVDQYRRVNQLNHVKNNGIPDRSASITSGWDFGDGEVNAEIMSGQTTSRENRVTHNKPLSTAWNPNTSIAEDKAAFAADQKPGNLGYNLDGRTMAQIDKAKDDAVARTMISLHPDQVRPAEKAARRSSKVAGTLQKALNTGSEATMNSAISAANTMSKTDEYFSRSGNEAYHNTKELNKVKNQVTEQHARMIKNYEKKSGTATSQQNSSDKLKFIAQDFKKDKAAGKYSLNSNSTSSTPVNSNNLFRNERFATDITSGKKRFKL
mgnify:FL=1|jgi:hypothetical protein|tara:strand:+ start:280 stop:1500 length:1221 start_codon:yes stop_codon:yes gene_type:complete